MRFSKRPRPSLRWIIAIVIQFALVTSSPSVLAVDIAPIRVACLGDSITVGARVQSDTQSYPARLQEFLGDGYEVQNFGIGGATLIKTGRPTVWRQLEAVMEFQPHIAIIALGTNDTVGDPRGNWEQIERFDKDYTELIVTLSGLATRPKIVVCTPTAMVLETEGLSQSRLDNLRERKPRLQKLCGQIRELARTQAHRGVTLLELNSVLTGHPEWLTSTDGVHPNVEGYASIAKAVSRHLRSIDSKRPNLVLFLVDDMGWQDTSVPFHTETTLFNKRYRTPNMERLAERGVRFTQAYACSVCSPTRVSLMSGLNAARHRVTNWTLRKNATNDGKHATLEFPDWNVNGLSPVAGIERTVHVKALPEQLREVGYRTIHVGKAHFGAVGTPGADPKNIGFDRNIGGHAAGGPGSYLAAQNFSAVWRKGDPIWDVPGLEPYHGTDLFLTEALTREANHAVDEAVEQGRPFFLYMAHYAVHVPFAEDVRFYSKYLEAGLEHTEAMYAAMVEGMDKSLGDIVQNIERHGLSENTIVLFMSDNGGLSAHGRGGTPHSHNAPLSSGKGSAREGGVRVPMIVAWPGVTEGGTECRQTVIIEDFFPSILEMAGIDQPRQVGGIIDGRSFLPWLRNGFSEPIEERALYWHFPNCWGPNGPGIGASSAMRLGRWKLIYDHADQSYELFDLDEDIGEQNNLSASNPGMRDQLARKLGAYLKSVNAQMPTDKTTGERVPYPGLR